MELLSSMYRFFPLWTPDCPLFDPQSYKLDYITLYAARIRFFFFLSFLSYFTANDWEWQRAGMTVKHTILIPGRLYFAVKVL